LSLCQRHLLFVGVPFVFIWAILYSPHANAFCMTATGKCLSGLTINSDLSNSLKIAEKIIKIVNKKSEGETDRHSDQKVEVLYRQGLAHLKKFFTGSPAINGWLFEQQISPLFTAVTSYYEISGSIGLSLPALKDAQTLARNSYALLSQQSYTLQIARIQLQLGFPDKALHEIKELTTYINNFYKISPTPDLNNLDVDGAYSYLHSKATLFETKLLEKRRIDPETMRQEFNLAARILAAMPAVKYTHPSLDVSADLDTMGTREAAGKYLRTDHSIYSAYTRGFLAAGDIEYAKKANDLAQNAYSENVSSLAKGGVARTNRSSSLAIGARSFGIFNLQNQNLVYKTYPMRSRVWAALLLARVQSSLGDSNKALSYVGDAKNAFKKVDELYQKLPKIYRRVDKIDKDLFDVLMLEAYLMEKQGHHARAAESYQRVIRLSERIRESLSVDLRNHFFQSVSKDAYLGLLRSSARVYENKQEKYEFDTVLTALNCMQSRQLRDLLQVSTSSFSDFDGSNSEEENQPTEDEARLSVAALQEKLVDHEIILFFSDLDDQILVGMIGKSGYGVSLQTKPDLLDESVHKIREKLVQNREFAFSDLAKLTEPLLSNVQQAIKASNRIIVLSDGALTSLPAYIWPIDKNSIIADYASVRYLTALDMLGSKNIESRKPKLLAIADPAYNVESTIRENIGKDLINKTRNISEIQNLIVPLPETRDEVLGISAIFGDKRNKLLLGKAASESTLKQLKLTSYNYIHIATHGLLGNEIPSLNEPALLLSYEAKEDGFLKTSEVMQLKMDADLTVLSACNTGNGKYYRGEGLTGISRAFMVAGSKQVIASLWPVDSYATTEMMVRLYKEINKGKSVEKALYDSQQAYRKSKKAVSTNQTGRALKLTKSMKFSSRQFAGRHNPFYWSPFILISSY